MRAAFAVADVRAAERATGGLLSDGTLMHRAATSLAVVVADAVPRVYGARVVVLVGSGDNGGDALHAGALLARRGARVHAVLITGSGHRAGMAAVQAAGGRLVNFDDASASTVIREAEVVIDGIVGIGGTAGLRPAAIEALADISDDALVIAADLPSGVDPDTGVINGSAVTADVTLCFGALKPGVMLDPGASRAGVVLSVDIGITDFLPDPSLESLEADDIGALLRVPVPGDDKYTRGVVGIAAGSAQYTGAACLAVAGATGAGVGMARFCGEPVVAALVRAAHPDVIVTERPLGQPLAATGRVQAWVVGPGGGTDDAAAELLAAVLAEPVPVVVDASALELVADRADLRAAVRARTEPTVLTPHAGELARLLGVERSEVQAQRLAYAERATDELGATVLLKGSTTLVVQAGHPARVNAPASPWLATAGSGDVLAGVIGALLASGLGACDAASVGAWLHAAAGARACRSGPITAGDLAAALRGAVAAVLAGEGTGDSQA